MVYDRYSRDAARGNRDFDYGRDYGTGRDYTYSSARDFEAAGEIGDDRGRSDYGRADYGRGGYGQQQGGYDRQAYGARDYGHDRYARREQFGRGQQQAGGSYQGAYASDGRPFEDVGRYRDASDDNNRDRNRGGYGRQPQGYRYEDRGFLDRAGDEVRSWFGDEDAERRRDMDARHDERGGRTGRTVHDEDYHNWRSGQIASLDRDYDEYRNENRSRFEKEFSSWRTNRQGQRDAMGRVTEHQEVVGSDGEHVGTVDKVKGDRILLTKNDKDAGGQHHSIPCSWITTVDDKVTLNKSAAEAKQAWQDEDRSQAMFGYGDNAKQGDADRSGRDARSGTNLNRSFSGTY